MNNTVPDYSNMLLKLNNEPHKRNMHNGSSKFVTLWYAREREDGKTVSVLTSKLWNMLPTSLR